MAQSDGEDPQALALAKATATIRELRGLISDADRALRELRAQVEVARGAAANQITEHQENLRTEFKRDLDEMVEDLGKAQEGAEARILRKFDSLLKMMMVLPQDMQGPGMTTLEDMVALHADPAAFTAGAVGQMFAPLPPHKMARAVKAQRKSRKGR